MRRTKYPISCTMLTTRKFSATVYIHRKFKTDGEHRKIQKTQNDVCTTWTQYDVCMTHPKHNTMFVWHSTNTLWCVTSHKHVWCLYDITDTLHYKHGDTVGASLQSPPSTFTMTRSRTGKCGAEERDFSFLQHGQTGYRAHLPSYSIDIAYSFLWDKAAEAWSCPLSAIYCRG